MKTLQNTPSLSTMMLFLWEKQNQYLMIIMKKWIRKIFAFAAAGTIMLTGCSMTDTIEDVIEPYLMQLGFVQRTPRGRIITDAGYKHLGLDK